jgi:hypothetical protein
MATTRANVALFPWLGVALRVMTVGNVRNELNGPLHKAAFRIMPTGVPRVGARTGESRVDFAD